MSAEHRREGGWYLALPDAGNGTTKNACPYQNKFGEKILNMSGNVTAAEYNRVYIIMYIFLIHIRVHLDTLNINLKKMYIYSELSIVYMHGDTILGIQWVIQYSLVNFVWDTASTGSYGVQYFLGAGGVIH